MRGSNPFNAHNIDHHPYRHHQGELEDRSSEHSSFELLADVIGTELTPYQRLIAANKAGSLEPLRDELRRQGIAPESAMGKSWVTVIRLINRCAQGVTPDDEAQAIRDLALAERRGDKALVRYSTHLWTPQADRLLADPDSKEHLHAPASGDGRWVYYGPRRKAFHNLELPHSWMGGSDESGYYGIVDPTPQAQERLLQTFWGS